MKELLALLLAVCLILGMAACGDGTVQPTFTASEPISETASEEPSQPEFPSNGTTSGTSSILIAYFSWADNTVVTDAEAAVKSALGNRMDAHRRLEVCVCMLHGEIYQCFIKTSDIPMG